MSWRRLLAGALFVASLAGCAGLPSLEGRRPSVALTDTGASRLGQAVQPMVAEHPGQSGLLSLVNGRDAFAARVRLADTAERSLDVQYYIWQNDLTGKLLIDALRRAADRGVRVRLLIDDNGIHGLDDVIAAAVAHRNVEVRLFNPFASRGGHGIEWMTDFLRLNRRMHNKSFTADNQVTIIGGRNIGDSYFGADSDLLFVDLDVLAIGPVVADVSSQFDAYWASDSAYPAERLIAPAQAEAIAAVRADVTAIERSVEAAEYVAAVAQQPLVRKMIAHDISFEWAVARLVSDDPAKGRGRADEADFMWSRLKTIMQPPTTELSLVSAYFVPGESGVEYLCGLARSGVKVTVLTNSLEATDVAAVHSGYAKWRVSMLAAGVGLWEVKRAATTAPTLASHVRLPSPSGSESRSGSGSGASSGSSLHAKVFEIDRSQLFIGSFNFDPRSRLLNTELGFVIDSPAMATEMAETTSARLAGLAYRLRLSPTGSIQWIEQSQGREFVHDSEPGTTFWQRLGVDVLSLLPIEWLL